MFSPEASLDNCVIPTCSAHKARAWLPACCKHVYFSHRCMYRASLWPSWGHTLYSGTFHCCWLRMVVMLVRWMVHQQSPPGSCSSCCRGWGAWNMRSSLELRLALMCVIIDNLVEGIWEENPEWRTYGSLLTLAATLGRAFLGQNKVQVHSFFEIRISLLAGCWQTGSGPGYWQAGSGGSLFCLCLFFKPSQTLNL